MEIILSDRRGGGCLVDLWGMSFQDQGREDDYNHDGDQDQGLKKEKISTREKMAGLSAWYKPWLLVGTSFGPGVLCYINSFVFVCLYILSLNLYSLSPGQRWRVSPLVVCVPVEFQ